MGEDWPKITARRDIRVSPWMTVIERAVEFSEGAAPELYHAVGQQDYIAIVARTPEGLIPIVRQYRPAVERFTWELPAGLRDVSGEPLRKTAERELREETGYQAGDWQVLIDFYSSPGISTESIRVFLARDLAEVPAAQRDFVPRHEETRLEIGWVALDGALDAFLAGDLHNGVAAVGILSAYAARARGFSGLRAAGDDDD